MPSLDAYSTIIGAVIGAANAGGDPRPGRSSKAVVDLVRRAETQAAPGAIVQAFGGK